MFDTYCTNRALLHHTVTKEKGDSLVSIYSFHGRTEEYRISEAKMRICYEYGLSYLLSCMPTFGTGHEGDMSRISTGTC